MDIRRRMMCENPPKHAIYYTSMNKMYINPKQSDPSYYGGAKIISNIYHRSSNVGIITFDSPIIMIGDGAFFGCTNLLSIIIPNTVTLIGDDAFKSCRYMRSIVIPDNVTTIGKDAFMSCTSLTSITIPDSVTSIGRSAFRDCTSLTSVTIGNSVTTIGDTVFFNCNAMTSVTIGNSVTSIGVQAFGYCTSMTRIYCKPTTQPTIETNVFNNIKTNGILYYPSGSNYSLWLRQLGYYNWRGQYI